MLFFYANNSIFLIVLDCLSLCHSVDESFSSFFVVFLLLLLLTVCHRKLSISYRVQMALFRHSRIHKIFLLIRLSWHFHFSLFFYYSFFIFIFHSLSLSLVWILNGWSRFHFIAHFPGQNKTLSTLPFSISWFLFFLCFPPSARFPWRNVSIMQIDTQCSNRLR